MVLQKWWQFEKYVRIPDDILPPTGHYREPSRLHFVRYKNIIRLETKWNFVSDLLSGGFDWFCGKWWYCVTFSLICMYVFFLFLLLFYFWENRGRCDDVFSSEGLTTSTGPKKKHIVVRLRDKYLVIPRHFLSVDIFRPGALVVAFHEDAQPSVLS